MAHERESTYQHVSTHTCISSHIHMTTLKHTCFHAHIPVWSYTYTIKSPHAYLCALQIQIQHIRYAWARLELSHQLVSFGWIRFRMCPINPKGELFMLIWSYLTRGKVMDTNPLFISARMSVYSSLDWSHIIASLQKLKSKRHSSTRVNHWT